MSEGKEITLHHNGYEISIKIEEDYNKTIEKIKKKLYFTDKDMEKYQIFYYDEDKLECDFDEDSYEEAYSNEEFTEFGLRLEVQKGKGVEGVDEEEIKEKLKKQKEKINKIWTEKLGKKCKKYEKKIKELEDKIKNFKEKNTAFLDDLKKIQETSIENTIKEVISAAEQKIGEICDQYNKDLCSTVNAVLEQNSVGINTECNNIKKGIESLNNKQDDLDKIFNDTKDNVSDLFKSTSNIGGKKKK